MQFNLFDEGILFWLHTRQVRFAEVRREYAPDKTHEERIRGEARRGIMAEGGAGLPLCPRRTQHCPCPRFRSRSRWRSRPPCAASSPPSLPARGPFCTQRGANAQSIDWQVPKTARPATARASGRPTPGAKPRKALERTACISNRWSTWRRRERQLRLRARRQDHPPGNPSRPPLGARACVCRWTRRAPPLFEAPKLIKS